MTSIYKDYKLNTSLETDTAAFIQCNNGEISRKRLTFEKLRTDPWKGKGHLNFVHL